MLRARAPVPFLERLATNGESGRKMKGDIIAGGFWEWIFRGAWKHASINLAFLPC